MASSSRFRACLEIVLKHEGGFVDHPRDPGGATNMGVSLRYARTLGSLLDLDKDGDVDRDDIVQVNLETAAVVYQNWFWRDVRGDELPAGVDLAVFDFAVNSGGPRAIRYLQKVLGVQQDGVFGPETMKATKARDPLELINGLNNERLTFLKGLAIWPTFGRGWQSRVDDVWQNAVKMVGTPNMTVSESVSSPAGQTASFVAVTGAVATMAGQFQPIVSTLGAATPWVMGALIVLALGAAIFWRARKT